MISTASPSTWLEIGRERAVWALTAATVGFVLVAAPAAAAEPHSFRDARRSERRDERCGVSATSDTGTVRASTMSASSVTEIVPVSTPPALRWVDVARSVFPDARDLTPEENDGYLDVLYGMCEPA